VTGLDGEVERVDRWRALVEVKVGQHRSIISEWRSGVQFQPEPDRMASQRQIFYDCSRRYLSQYPPAQAGRLEFWGCNKEEPVALTADMKLVPVVG